MVNLKVGSVPYMLMEIEKAISKCTAPEKECYEELVALAEGWEMRLQELEQEEDEEDA